MGDLMENQKLTLGFTVFDGGGHKLDRITVL